jgi:hypothetical protein
LQQFGALLRQPFPHEPQFAEFVVVFTHLLPHFVCPATSQDPPDGTAVPVGSTTASIQVPAEQTLVDGQLYPHRPQFDRSVCSSKQYEELHGLIPCGQPLVVPAGSATHWLLSGLKPSRQ